MKLQDIVIQLKTFFRSKSFLSNIILINVAVWVATLLFGIIGFLFALNKGAIESYTYDYFALSSEFSTLIHKPWSIITYMFLHSNVFHLLFNMLMLYYGGILFSQYMGKSKLIRTYFASGIAGGLLFMIAWNIFPAFSQSSAVVVGASAAVLGVFVAVATYIPNYTINLFLIGNTKLKYVAVALVILDLFSISKGNAGGHFAHIGGALYGFLSIYLPRQIHFKKPDRVFKKVIKNKKKTTHQRPLSDEEYNKRRAAEQKKIDEILDKISKSGYDKLSKEEKEFLFKSSQK